MKTIAFLGDSITYGYDLPDKSKRYSTLLAQRLGLTEENYGITGTLMTKSGLNAFDKKDFVSRMPLIGHADIAVIFGGTNDYFWSDKPIHGKQDDSYFEHAIDTICTYVKSVRSERITLFVTPYPHNGIGNYFGGETWKDSSRHDTSAVNFNGHTLSEYAMVIEEACQSYGLPCLNLHKAFDFDWKQHTTDGCHPNEAGHRLLMRAIEGRLEELIVIKAERSIKTKAQEKNDAC